MLNLNQERFYSAGGVGDTLTVLNKMHILSFHDKPIFNLITNKNEIVKGGVTLIWFCSNQKYADYAEELGRLNSVDVKAIVCDPDAEIKKIKELNLHNIFNTAYNGDISGDENGLKYFDSDMIQVSDSLVIHGALPDKFPDKSYMVLQMDAGVIFHNPRKHWNNQNFVLSFVQKVCKKYSLDCVVFGNSSNKQLPEGFINCPDTGFQCIEYLKRCKFSICLSGFGTMASLMSKIPTIWKSEGEFISNRYYGHPEWKKRGLEIQEIVEDKDKIIEFIEKSL